MPDFVTLALTGASEASLHAAAGQLFKLAAGQGVQLLLCPGVTTAHAARSVYIGGGELWQVGDEHADCRELAPLVDRTVDDSTPDRLTAGIARAWTEMRGKVRVAA